MGYCTSFMGELKFTKELTAKELAAVKSFCGEDCRDHPEWEGSEDLTWIKLELLDDFSGIKWSEVEKTYNMTECVNLIIINMKKKYPDFGLTGKLIAQGEEIGDLWELVIGEDGLAIKVKTPPSGTKIECPQCEEEFYWKGK